MHVKITNLIINFVTRFDLNGGTVSMFGSEQRKKVVLAAMTGLVDRWNVAWKQIGVEDRRKVAWQQRLAWRIARRSPGSKDWSGRSPEGRPAAKIGLEGRQEVAWQQRLA